MSNDSEGKTTVILTRNYPRYSETFILRQAAALNAAILYRTPDTYIESDLFSGKSYCLTSGKIEHSIVNNGTKIIDRLVRRPTADWTFLNEKRFLDYLKKHDVKSVIAQYGPSGIVSAAPTIKAGRKHITHFHGYDLSRLLRNELYLESLKKLIAQGGEFVVVNTDMQSYLTKELNADENKVHLIPCGAPVQDISYTDRRQRNRPYCQFLFVGRYTDKKDPLGLIKAFHHCLNNTNVDVKLTMAGGGTLMNDVVKQCQRLNIERHVTVLPSQSVEQIKQMLRDADVYVQHSVTSTNGDKEGWPISISEACSSGLPVVSTKHAGIKDQIKHGVTGYLVEERDYEAMGIHMAELAENREQRLEMGMAGRAFMEKEVSFEIQVEKLRRVASK